MIRIPFERYTLDNGLRVVLSREARAGVVAVNLWYDVGSKNERPGRTGFAHLFEHMMFQGSENVPETSHFSMIEKAGGTLNGSTWLDRTNYYETLPAHYLSLALWLEADRMARLLPAMTQEKFDNQRDVVKNERRWRVDNQPYGDWDERLQALVYPRDHPYHHSVIGSMEDLDAATLQDVEEFFRTYYTPNNAVLTICGEFDEAEARRLVQENFAPIPRGPERPPLPGNTQVERTLGGEVRQTVHQDISLPRCYFAFRVPRFGDDAFYAAHVASAVLGSGKSSHLYRTLVREERLAQDAVTFVFPLVEGAAMLIGWVTALPGMDVERVCARAFEVIDSLQRVAGKEVERAVHLLEARQLLELQRMEERADQLSMYTTLFNDPARVNTEVDRIRAVGASEVRSLARDFLIAENRVLLQYLPARG